MAERVPILNNDLQRISEAVSQLVNNGTIKISELLSLVGEFIAVLEGGKEGEYDDNNPQNRAKAILCIKRAITQASLKRLLS